MACNCTNELNAIVLAIEAMSLSMADLLTLIAEDTDLIKEEVVGLATPLNAIATNTTNLAGINTGTGVSATALTFIGTQLDLIEGYQAAQAVANTAQAAAQGTLAAEMPLLVAATEQGALNAGAVANNVGVLSDLIPPIIDIESDLFSLANSAIDIEDTLNAIEACVCEESPQSPQWFVQIDGPTPETNYSASDGGDGASRFFPYCGVTFRPRNTFFPDGDFRFGQIEWVTYKKSLVKYPDGGPEKWEVIIVPSPAISASELTVTDVQI